MTRIATIRPEGRFGNDFAGFEEVFNLASRDEDGARTGRNWLAKGWRKAEHCWTRLTDCFWGGQERGALRHGVGWARGGWVYVAPNNVWRFDTGGGKRILGVAQEIGKESRMLILSWGEKADGGAFRDMGGGVGILRLPQGEKGWQMAERVLAGAKGCFFVNPMHYAHWKKMGRGARVIFDTHGDFMWTYSSCGMDFKNLVETERKLLEDAEAVWFCTETDWATTARRHVNLAQDKWALLPNGILAAETGRAIVPSEARQRRQKAGWKWPVVIFVGANYGPNYEAVEDICRNWAPKFPEVSFVVLGMRLDRYLRDGGCKPTVNMVFTGLVAEREKKVLYDLAEIAIVPTRRGTGSSLKVPEAVARGKVVIGTRIGLRGFTEWAKWESVILTEAGPEALGRVLEQLRARPDAYDISCRCAAEEMQRRYTWESLMAHWRGTW